MLLHYNNFDRRSEPFHQYAEAIVTVLYRIQIKKVVDHVNSGERIAKFHLGLTECQVQGKLNETNRNGTERKHAVVEGGYYGVLQRGLRAIHYPSNTILS